jgi:hypothetical protein
VLIMDEDFARAAGLTVSGSQSNRSRFRFADNTTAIISGMTFGVKWEFGDSGVSGEHDLDFHILKNAPAAVILSDDFLFGTNAISKYDYYLVDEGVLLCYQHRQDLQTMSFFVNLIPVRFVVDVARTPTCPMVLLSVQVLFIPITPRRGEWREIPSTPSTLP